MTKSIKYEKLGACFKLRSASMLISVSSTPESGASQILLPRDISTAAPPPRIFFFMSVYWLGSSKERMNNFMSWRTTLPGWDRTRELRFVARRADHYTMEVESYNNACSSFPRSSLLTFPPYIRSTHGSPLTIS